MSAPPEPTEKFIGDFPTTVNATVVVKIQNVFSKLWAYAPDVNNLDSEGKAPLRVEPNTFQYERNETWVITIISVIPSGKYIDTAIVTIKNLGTGLYAWDVEDPPEHTPVYEKATERYWKIEHADDGHYKITPTGPKQDVLFWTDLNPSPGSIITLERDSTNIRDSEEKRHWYIYKISGTANFPQA